MSCADMIAGVKFLQFIPEKVVLTECESRKFAHKQIMNYHITRPSPLLSGVVRHYWMLDNCLPKGGEHVQRIVPNGLTDLVFYLDTRPQITGLQGISMDSGMISGQMHEYYDLKITGHISLFAVTLQPQGLSRLLDMPGSELCNLSIPLRFLFRDFYAKLEDQLHSTVSFRERVRCMEGFLLTRLSKCSMKYNSGRINSSLRLINNARGLVSIESLASAACCSRRQYERIFTEVIGTSPARFLRTVRFQSAIHIRSRQPESTLTSLAYDSGFADQSHMCNEFVRFSGMPPGQFFGECEPFSDYFQEIDPVN